MEKEKFSKVPVFSSLRSKPHIWWVLAVLFDIFTELSTDIVDNIDARKGNVVMI